MENKPPAAKVPGARALALEILAQAARDRRSVEDLLYAVYRRQPLLPRRERAFLLELVQGVKRWELRLDYILSRISNLPLEKLHPLVLQILRLGAFQILMLDKIPYRAAINEAGKLAKRRGLPQAHTGFINAVLRRLAAEEAPPLPVAAQDPVAALSVEHSHPAWLVRRWLDRCGFEKTEARLAANNRIPPTTIRINRRKTDRAGLMARLAKEGMEASPCRFSPLGLVVEAVNANPLELPSFKEGLWLFQDEAAHLVSLLLPLRPGARLVEIGCGRGGKTTHLGEAMGGQGLLLAVDYHKGRLQELRQNVARWGLDLVRPVRADAAAGLPLKPGSMEAVVLDVPCSALGILRRHPEIKTRLQDSDLATFPLRQRGMLEHGAGLLKSGGSLLYITCTTEPEENEEIISSFLLCHPNYSLATNPELLPPSARIFVQPPGWFRTSPEDHGLDGFFGAVLVKR